VDYRQARIELREPLEVAVEDDSEETARKELICENMNSCVQQ
jgi:hypothetical protein